MQINFLGDSITYGVGATSVQTKFPAVVCKHFGATENNFGECGTRFAKQSWGFASPHDEYFIIRAKRMPTDADFTVVMGGTNDFGHGDAPLGNLGDQTEDTFYGACEQLVTYLVQTYTTKKLVFVLPLPRSDQNDMRVGQQLPAMGKLSEYVEIEKQVLQKHGVDFLDLSNVMPCSPDACEQFYMDGLHPNDFGHNVIAQHLINYLQNKI